MEFSLKHLSGQRHVNICNFRDNDRVLFETFELEKTLIFVISEITMEFCLKYLPNELEKTC